MVRNVTLTFHFTYSKDEEDKLDEKLKNEW